MRSHLDALISVIEKGKKRSQKKIAALVDEVPASLQPLFRAWADHEPGFIDIGDFFLEKVPFWAHTLDGAPKGKLLVIGQTGGGDLWTLDCASGKILRLLHDEGLIPEKRRFASLNHLLEDQALEAGSSDLDEALDEPVAGPLTIAPTKRPEDEEKPDLKAVKLAGADGWVGAPVGGWCLALTAERKFMFIDHQKMKAHKTKLEAADCQQSLDGKRALVTTGEGIWEIEGDRVSQITKDVTISAVYLGELVAATLLVDNDPLEFGLQLYKRQGKKLVREGVYEDCGPLQTVRLAAGGKLLLLMSDQPKKKGFVLGVRGTGLRVLASHRGMNEVWDAPSGRVFIRDESGKAFELQNIDGALQAAFAKKAALKLT